MLRKKKTVTAAPEPEKTRILSFAGVSHADIVYYMAKLAAVGREQVLCIDNSERLDLIRSIHKADGEESAQVGNILYLADRAWEEETYQKFDAVVIYHGMEIDREIWENSTERYFMVDTDRFDLLDAREALEAFHDQKLTLLVVDAFFEKIQEKDLPELLKLPEEMVEEIVPLQFEPDDLAALQSFQFNGIQKVKDTTGSMQDFLMTLYFRIYGPMKKRDFRKLAVKAR
jgi:hypothetical protein